jgi:hypothetical protein
VAEADRFYPFLTQIRIELPVAMVPMMVAPMMMTPVMMMPSVVVPAMMPVPSPVPVMPVDRYGLETIDLVLRHDRGLSTYCARLHQSLIG